MTITPTVMTSDRWITLMKAINLEASIDCYHDLVNAYSERHRHYHTVRHIEAELAIWFHDGIYQPFSKNSERDSARWAYDFLEGAGFDLQACGRVHELIMATMHGVVGDNESQKNSDRNHVVDIDLAILGAPADIYDEFERNVRREYKWVPGFIYKRKRKALLECFLKQPSVYRTDFFIDRYEQAARNNLRRASAAL